MGTETPTCLSEFGDIEKILRKQADLMAELNEKNDKYANAYARADELLAVAKAARKTYDDYCDDVLRLLSKDLTEARSAIQDNQSRLLTELLAGFVQPTVN